MKRVLSLVLLLFLLFSAALAEDSILFLNVGKGDAALIRCSETCYLVDTGTKAHSQQVLDALDRCGISHLNGIIITHTDKDHVGGLKKLLKAGIQADCLYCGTCCALTDSEHPVLEAGEKYNIPVVRLSAESTLSLNETCEICIIGPLTEDPGDEDNNSLVFRLNTPNGSALFTGDMKLEAERLLLSCGLIAHAEVLKVPHHGQADAGSARFFNLVNPEIAIIPTDIHEDNETADSKIIQRLWDTGAKVLITQDTEIGYLVKFTEEGAVCSAFQ